MADLVTTADLKTFIGITSSSDDTLLGDIISSVSAQIEKYLGYTIAETTYTNEEYHGTGTDRITLNHFPVTSFSRLQERTALTNENDWDTVDTDLYYTDTDAGLVLMPGGFIRGYFNYRVTYDAGYSETPSDLELVTWQLCRDVYNSRKTSGTIKSEGLKDYRVTYAEVMGLATPEARTTLNQYRDRI